MGIILYLIILVYFLIGGVLVYLINKKRLGQDKNQNWLKFSTFFVIANILFLSVIIDSTYFHYISIVIILVSYFEIVRLTYTTGKLKTGILSLLFFTLFSYTFIRFSLLDKQIIIIVLFIVFIFDAFSQLIGQMKGKRKLLPRISPNKTVEGLLGGCIFAIISSMIIFKMLNKDIFQSVYYGIGISAFALLGDIAASYIKRKFQVKDYGRLLPGHGGFLDRFDSLIFSGSFIYIFETIVS